MATETQGAGSAQGLPQLDPSTFGNQIFWLLVALGAIYLILSRVALPRISAVIAERQGTITGDLATAEDLKAKATEAEKAYNKALADARAEAQRIIGDTKAQIKTDLEKANAEADAEIAEKTAEREKRIAEIREEAMQSVRDVARETTGDVVTAMGGKPDADAVEAAVARQLKEDR